jgi:chromosome partitioning protein
MTTRIVAVLNQKGGVGKTTTVVNLAHALALKNQRVTVIDLDPQAHLTVSLGVISRNQTGIDVVMLGESRLQQQIMTVRPNLQLIAAGTRLQEIEQLNAGVPYSGNLLYQALSGNFDDQDFVLIDCPPSSGVLVANALMAADELLIPMASDYLALQGLSHLMGTLKKFEAALKKNYRLRIVISRFVTTRKISNDVLELLLKYFSGKILTTKIKETSFLAECPSFGKTAFEYRPGCRSALDFNELATDFLEDRVL